LIQRLNGEPNQRLLCGFTNVPGKATFPVVYHVNRDSTAIPAREVVKKAEEKAPKPAKKRGRPAKNTPKAP
jgi:hypothetical protein